MIYEGYIKTREFEPRWPARKILLASSSQKREPARASSLKNRLAASKLQGLAMPMIESAKTEWGIDWFEGASIFW